MPRLVLLDASVLYPSLIRNLLMHLATNGLIAARWTDQIHQEWTRHLRQDRLDLSIERLERIRDLMNTALPDATVTDYEALIAGLSLPDPDDQHVLAAALHAQVEGIVTLNLRHFPSSSLPEGLVAQTPDMLLIDLLEEEPEGTVAAIEALRHTLRAPPYSWAQLLDRLDAGRAASDGGPAASAPRAADLKGTDRLRPTAWPDRAARRGLRRCPVFALKRPGKPPILG